MNPRFFAATLVILCYVAKTEAAFLTGPFGPYGEGGASNGQPFNFGNGGSIFEIDSFLQIGGRDLNGPTLGTSGQLSIDLLPVELQFAFSSSLSADQTDLTLRYTFTNTSGTALSDVRFFSFVDPEIDEGINTYFNEAATAIGSMGSGAGDTDPDSFEIDEPGYLFGDIFDNLLLGSLDNTNAIPASFPDDVSLALGFDLGTLLPSQQAIVEIFLSEDGDSIGSLSLRHFDTDPNSSDILTMSGTAEVVSAASSVPEPSSICLLMFGTLLLLFARRRLVPHYQ